MFTSGQSNLAKVELTTMSTPGKVGHKAMMTGGCLALKEQKITAGGAAQPPEKVAGNVFGRRLPGQQTGAKYFLKTRLSIIAAIVSLLIDCILLNLSLVLHLSGSSHAGLTNVGLSFSIGISIIK